MKIFTIVLFSIVLIPQLYAQTFTVTFDDSLKIVPFNKLPIEKDIIFTHKIENKTDKAITVTLINKDIKTPNTWFSFFCTDFCYPKETDTVDLTIEAMGFMKIAQHVYVGDKAENQFETFLRCQNSENPQEGVQKRFVASTHIKIPITVIPKESEGRVFTVIPGKNSFHLHFQGTLSENISVTLSSPLGITLKKYSTRLYQKDKGNLSFVIPPSATGMYFLSFVINGNIYTQKLPRIRH